MSEEGNKDVVFGANWVQDLGGNTNKSSPRAAAPDMGDFALLGGQEETENPDSPLLDQGEVDSLWGKRDDGEEANKKGLGLLVNSQRITAERLPALEGIYERFARISASSMRYFTAENVDVTFGKIVPMRFGDFLNSVELPSLLVIFKAEQWESRGLIVLDNQLIYAIVDILHGGRRTRQLQSNEGKPYTVIETHMIQRMVNSALKDLESAFDPVSVVNFHYERMENDSRFATIALPSNTAVVADFTIGIDRRIGTMRIIMPYRTLEPVKTALSQQLLGESFGESGTWTRHFSESLRVSNIELEAVLSEYQSTLGEAFAWQRGSILEIDLPLDPQITVHSGGTPLFVAGMGRKEGHLALRLLKRAEGEGETGARPPKQHEHKQDDEDSIVPSAQRLSNSPEAKATAGGEDLLPQRTSLQDNETPSS